MSSRETVHLSAMMGTYPMTRPLKSGEVGVAGAELEFAPFEQAVPGFRGVVRELKYDVAELALSTFLQAHSVGKPFVMLPFVTTAKFHHRSLLRLKDNPFTADQLAGRRVAMRAYAQTTPTWVRGILMEDYGVRSRDVKWLVQEDGHVAECSDPPWVSTIDSSRSLFDLLLDGEVESIIFGGKREEDPRITTVLADPDAEAKDWAARHNCSPINHVVVIRDSIAEERPDLVRAVYSALVESRRVGQGLPEPGTRNLQPYGFDAIEPGIEVAVRYGVEQGLIPRPVGLDELYGSVREALQGVA